ncbi:MAG: FGGY-family carbohydrate kinase [Synechococcales cyanobacterium T60_A2020_003]|nr:FGGY-family carbohydrate kinase [Synechococcales cyanobacterium T60_A2020_003]
MLALGIDVGTSGARAVVIDGDRTVCAQSHVVFPELDQGKAKLWRDSLYQLLTQIPPELRSRLGAIALNGTSSTVMLCDTSGQPITEPLMYNDAQNEIVLDVVRAIAPANHAVISSTSTFAKVVAWVEQGVPVAGTYLMHQADWLAFLLHGRLGISDDHNALKLGYDVGTLTYPDWLLMYAANHQITLPRVYGPGEQIGTVDGAIAHQFQIPSTCCVYAGTTDSIAAFLASGATQPGEAVTSLGSTLVLKLLSKTRIDDPALGIYSHRLGDLWLVGGASNTGGAVLRQFFTNAELETLSAQIPVDSPSLLDYYPLVKPGERFPVNDPTLQPRLGPRPTDPVVFLHGLLESIARIEALGYQRLQDLGATPLTHVYTAGGGAKNPAWLKIRDRHLPVSVSVASHTDAAYGSALLALNGRSAN